MPYSVRENLEKKGFNEQWGDDLHPVTNLMNIPKPFRMLIVGMPSSGKTSTLLRMLCYQDKPFENIWIMHPKFVNYKVTKEEEKLNKGIIIKPEEAKDDIKEYKGIDFVGYITYIPTQNFFENFAGQRNLLIIDDIELRNFCHNHQRLLKLNKLLSFTSTHHNLSIIVTSQHPASQLPSIVSEFCNFFILHKLRSVNQIIGMALKVGIPYATLKYLTSDVICKNIHDSITIDMTFNSPAKFRYNIDQPLPNEVEFLANPKNKTIITANTAIKELVQRALNISSEAQSEDD